jgi:hypothetical protein
MTTMNLASTLPAPEQVGAVVHGAKRYFRSFSFNRIIAVMAGVPVHLIDDQSTKSIQAFLSHKDSVEAANTSLVNLEKRKEESAP